MDNWKSAIAGWRTRAKAWKDRNGKVPDAELAAAITEIRWTRYPNRVESRKNVERATVNSWLNKRDPNLEDFFELCEVMEADPRYILFGETTIDHAISIVRAARSAPQELPAQDEASPTTAGAARLKRVRRQRRRKANAK